MLGLDCLLELGPQLRSCACRSAVNEVENCSTVSQQIKQSMEVFWSLCRQNPKEILATCRLKTPTQTLGRVVAFEIEEQRTLFHAVFLGFTILAFLLVNSLDAFVKVVFGGVALRGILAR